MAGKSFKLAEGHVEVHADTTAVPGEVEEVGKKSSGAAERAGSGIGGKIAAGIGGAIAAAGVAELITSNLAAGMGATVVAASMDGGPAEAARIGKLAGDLYGDNFGDSLEGVQQAIGAVIQSLPGMADASDEVVSRVSGKFANLESVMGIDVPRAAQVAGQMMRNGLAADADEAADLMTAAMQRVPPAVREDVVDAIDEYGPMFAQLGYSGEEAMAALVRGSEQGMYGIDKTGDALKELTIRATDMSSSSVEAYEAAGLNAEDMAAKILAGGDTARQGTNEIVQGLLGIKDPSAQANAAIALFGTPLEDLGTSKIPGFLESLGAGGAGMEGFAGSADRMGETLASSAGAKVEASKRQFETWALSLTNAEGPIGDLAAGVQAAGPEMVTAAGAAVSMGSAVVGIGKSVLGVIPVLAAKAAAMTATATATTAADVAAKRSVISTIAMRTAMVAGAVATGVVTAAQWAFNAAVSANPIGLIILAVVALIAAIVALVMNWDTVVSFLKTTWEGFVGWITPGLEAFGAWWNNLWAGFGGFVTDTWNNFTAGVRILFDAFVLGIQIIGDGIATWWNGLWSGIGQFLSDAWNGYINTVTTIFLAVYNTAVGIGSTIVGWWNGLWTGVGSFLSNAWNNYVNMVRNNFTNVLNTARGIGNGIVSWWNGLWSGIGNTLSGAWNGITGLITRGVENIINGFASLPGRIGSALAGLGSALMGAFRGPINGIIGLWNRFAGGLRVTVPDWVPGFGGNSWSLPKIPMLAKGGTITGSGAVMVGEEGPEILNLGRGASVIPLDRAGTPGGGSTDNSVHIDRLEVSVNAADLKEVEAVLELFRSLGIAARASGSSGFRFAPAR